MNTPLVEKLIIAISSRALFDLNESHRVFESAGEDAYTRYQIEREDVPLDPGSAYSLVLKLLALNRTAKADRVEVILLSRNSADTGLRVFNSIRHHGLAITRATFTRGESPYRYLRDFGAHLFLSTTPEDVRHALDAGIAAATILPSVIGAEGSPELRIAFDGDAVLFSDESERIFQQDGLGAFNGNELALREQPLPGGPFKPFLAALHRIQTESAADAPLIYARRSLLPAERQHTSG